MRLSLSSKNRSSQSQKHPRLRLDSDERARIVVMDELPWVEYIHNLRMPKIENGSVVYVQKTRNDGTVTEVLDTEWVSTVICTGSHEVLGDPSAGIDPENCVVCAEIAKGEGRIAPPTRKFAVNIVRYVTKAGSYDPQKPLRVDVVGWTFSEGVFNSLEELGREHGTEFEDEGGNIAYHLKNKDLNLRCKVKTYQLYDIQVGNESVWLRDDESRAVVMETFNENKLDDDALSSLCGQRKKAEWVQADLRKLNKQWDEKERIEAGDSITTPEPSGSLDDSLDSIDSLVSSPKSSGAAETTASSDDKPGSSGEVVNFSDLLDGIE